MCAVLFSSAIVNAQDTEKVEEVFELSPFEVNVDDNSGYRATSTLSGTRLNSSLADVASSISVMTSAFLEDIGATDVQDAYLYSVSVENENEYSPDDSEGESIATTNQSRVRGMMTASQTRNFFNTELRGDGYNSDRYTISRGPNSILYGTGSPAGLLNISTKRALLGSDSYSISYRFDSESSSRFTTDINKVLIEDKLAFRFASLDQDKQTWKDPEFDDEKRRYATFTYQPTESTTIKGNWETMSNNRSKARNAMAQDDVSAWIEAGKPLYDQINRLISQDGGQTWNPTVDVPGVGSVNVADLSSADAGLIGLDLDGGHPGVNGPRLHMRGQIELDDSAWDAIDDPELREWYRSQGTNWLVPRFTSSSAGSFDDRAPLGTFRDGSVLPTNYNIHGFASLGEYEADTYGLSLEHKFTENLFVEAAYNKEEYNRYVIDPIRTSGDHLRADTNRYLPLWDVNGTTPGATNGIAHIPDLDLYENYGQPGQLTQAFYREPQLADRLLDGNGDPVLIENPNLGRYYVEGYLIGYDTDIDQENLRLSASYSMDFRERAKWAGKHDVAILFQKDEISHFQRKLRSHYNPDFMYIQRAGNDFDDPRANPGNRYYLDIPGTASSGPNSLVFPDAYELDHPRYRVGGFRSDGRPVYSEREIEGQMVVLQSRFLEDKLITTLGFRNDEETLYQAPIGNNRDPQTREFILEPLPDEPLVTDGNTKTTGVVYKATDWLSLLYNRSDSFNPQGQFETFTGEPLAPQDGTGEEYGFALNLMEGKLSARVIWYEQTATGAIESDWTYLRVRNTVQSRGEQAIRSWWQTMDPAFEAMRAQNIPTDESGNALFVDNGVPRTEDGRQLLDTNGNPMTLASLAPLDNEGNAIDMTARLAWAESIGLKRSDYRPESANPSDFLRVTRDFTSKGMEMELFARPTENWDMRLTVAKQKAVNDRTLPHFLEFMEERRPVYDKYLNLPRNPFATIDARLTPGSTAITRIPYVADLADPTQDLGGIAQPDSRVGVDENLYRDGDGLGRHLVNHPNGYARIALAEAQQGIASDRVRKWRVNFTSKYTFRDGPLKGLQAGGGARWRSKAAIGYAGKPNVEYPQGDLVVDPTKPFFGEDILDIDGFVKYKRVVNVANREIDWTIQLNVSNLFDDDDAMPTEVHTDGSVIGWVPKAPRTWSISNTFAF